MNSCSFALDEIRALRIRAVERVKELQAAAEKLRTTADTLTAQVEAVDSSLTAHVKNESPLMTRQSSLDSDVQRLVELLADGEAAR